MKQVFYSRNVFSNIKRVVAIILSVFSLPALLYLLFWGLRYIKPFSFLELGGIFSFSGEMGDLSYLAATVTCSIIGTLLFIFFREKGHNDTKMFMAFWHIIALIVPEALKVLTNYAAMDITIADVVLYISVVMFIIVILAEMVFIIIDMVRNIKNKNF